MSIAERFRRTFNHFVDRARIDAQLSTDADGAQASVSKHAPSGNGVDAENASSLLRARVPLRQRRRFAKRASVFIRVHAEVSEINQRLPSRF
jgi:hypothetical protein